MTPPLASLANRDFASGETRPGGNTSIAIAVPTRPSVSSGNEVTAARWADHLRGLGHTVTIVPIDETTTEPDRASAAALNSSGVLLALHARRSAPFVRWWRAHHPTKPLIVALTGTDLYRDMPEDAAAMQTAADADALIVLQQAAVDRLREQRPEWANKTWVVHQSVDPDSVPQRRPAEEEFRVVVLAHLRPVKDPLLAAKAARLLPPSSRIQVHHGGRALTKDFAAAADAEMVENTRYTWHRELNRDAAWALLATAHVLACTSIAEGGANVVTEAIAAGVPVVGTRIDGNTGLLGDDHPGLVPVGDHQALAVLLDRLERDPDALAELEQRSEDLKPITDPLTERAALGAVLAATTK